jgi:hypothetical protein
VVAAGYLIAAQLPVRHAAPAGRPHPLS